MDIVHASSGLLLGGGVSKRVCAAGEEREQKSVSMEVLCVSALSAAARAQPLTKPAGLQHRELDVGHEKGGAGLGAGGWEQRRREEQQRKESAGGVCGTVGGGQWELGGTMGQGWAGAGGFVAARTAGVFSHE